MQAAQERGRRKRVAAVVTGRVPVGAGLDLDILLERAPEPRQPESLEQMDKTIMIKSGRREDLNRLLGPAALRHDHRRMAGIGDDDTWNRRNVGLQPVL